MKKIFYYLALSITFIFYNSCNLVDSHNNMPDFITINEINVLNINDSIPKILGRGSSPKIVPNENKILFVNERTNILYSINFDGSNLTQIINFNNYPFDYELSPNGKKIVLSVFENMLFHLYIMNSDGTSLTQLTNSPNNADLEPQFSDNNDKIVFRRDWDICIMNTDGSNFRYITKHPDSSYYLNPHFIFNDKKIVYFEETENNWRLHVYSLEDQSDSMLINLRYAYDILSNGKILFVESYNTNEIKVMDLKTNEIKNIAIAYNASFSNDGNKIIYSNGRDIYINNLNGDDEQLVYKEKEDNKKSINILKLSSDYNDVIFQTLYDVQTN